MTAAVVFSVALVNISVFSLPLSRTLIRRWSFFFPLLLMLFFSFAQGLMSAEEELKALKEKYEKCEKDKELLQRENSELIDENETLLSFQAQLKDTSAREATATKHAGKLLLELFKRLIQVRRALIAAAPRVAGAFIATPWLIP